MSLPCFIVFMYNRFTVYYYSFLVLYGRGAALHTQATLDNSVLPQWSKPLKIDGKDEFKRDMNIIWSKMRILACIVTCSSLFILLNYISFRSTQSLWEKYVWSEDRLLTLGRNQDVFWENNLFEGIGKFSFPLEPLPSIYRAVKDASYAVTKTKPEQNKSKQTNKQNANKKGEDGESRTVTYARKRKKKKEKRKHRQTNHCWFSHDVTKKIQTTTIDPTEILLSWCIS